MSNSKYSIDQLISAKSIAARVETLAKDITNHFINTEKLIVVGLLRGSFVFIADLAREIDLPIEMKFENNNEFRANIGLRFNIAVIAIHANHTFSKYPVTTLGLAVGLR